MISTLPGLEPGPLLPDKVHLPCAYSAFKNLVLSESPTLDQPLRRSIPRERYLASPAVFDEIVALSRDRLPQIIKYTKPMLQEAPHNVLRILREWGPEGWGIADRLKHSSSDLAASEKAFFTKIFEALKAEMRDDDFGVIAAHLPRAHMEEHPDHLNAIIEEAEGHLHAAFSQLSPILLKTFSASTLGKVVRVSSSRCEVSHTRLDAIARTYSGEKTRIDHLIATLSDRVKCNLPQLLKWADLRLFSKDNQEALLQFTMDYPDAAWALCKQYGAAVLESVRTEEVRRRICFVQELFGVGTPDYLAISASTEWNESAMRWHRELLGKAAGQTLKSGARWGSITPPDERMACLRANARQCNLHSFHRYTCTAPNSIDMTLLKQNIENLDPNVRRNLPLALVAFAEEDFNDSMRNRYQTLLRLSRSYKVIFVEISSTEDLIRYIKKFGDRNFSDNGLDLLFVNAHGSRNGVLWKSETGNEAAQELTIDELKDHSLDSCFSPRSVLIWGACEAAFPLEDGSSFLEKSLVMFPASVATGVQRAMAIIDLSYDSAGLVNGVHCSCSRRKVRTIKRDGSHENLPSSG